jgi:hypothetical protein
MRSRYFLGFLETNIDDPSLMDAYRLAGARSRPVIFSLEDTNRLQTPTTLEVSPTVGRVAEALPELNFQTNHMGYIERGLHRRVPCSRSCAPMRLSMFDREADADRGRHISPRADRSSYLRAPIVRYRRGAAYSSDPVRATTPATSRGREIIPSGSSPL